MIRGQLLCLLCRVSSPGVIDHGQGQILHLRGFHTDEELSYPRVGAIASYDNVSSGLCAVLELDCHGLIICDMNSTEIFVELSTVNYMNIETTCGRQHILLCSDPGLP